MINIRQAMAMITGSALWYGASAAQAGASTGTITFSPVAAAVATPVPMLGSTLLILLSLLLVFIAFVVFRRRQNGVASVIVGALALAALASAGGGVSVFHSAYAQATIDLTNAAGETRLINSNTLNYYVNGSGVPLVPESPVFTANDCNNNWAELNNACVVGSALADGAQCEIDCRLPR